VSTTTKGFIQPALFGGLAMGVLSALPLISVGNVCCCLWVIGGGLVAAYLLQQNQATPITPGDGALVGLLAGLIGALVQVVVSIPISMVVGPMERAMAQRLLEMAGNVPPEMREMFERYSGEGGSMAFAIIGLMALFFCMRFDYHRLRMLSPLIMLTAVVGLAVVLVVGSDAYGSRRWIQFGTALPPLQPDAYGDARTGPLRDGARHLSDAGSRSHG